MHSARFALPCFLVFALVACGGDGDGGPSTSDDTGTDTALDAGDTSTDTGGTDADDTGDDTSGDGGDVGVDTGPPTPGEIICTECETSADCSGDTNACLTYPDGGQFCGYDCADDETVCPSGTDCVPIGEGSGVFQCVPESLRCEDPCEFVECDPGTVCDPTQDGACVEPLEYCEPCVVNEQCGFDNDLCLTFNDIDRTTGCAQDCSGDPNSCPEGAICVDVNTPDGPVQQCVPEIGTCIDRCADVSCEEGEFCDPLNGECNSPRGPCAPCARDLECGTEADRCIGLPGPPCRTDVDCGADEFCGAGGECVAARCGVDCSEDPLVCPDGYACYNLADGAAQCLPVILACEDRCDDVECDDGENCDAITGLCVESELKACGSPCTDNAECGGQDDLCINVGTGAFCAYECDAERPCPLGYSCLETFSGLNHCIPSNFEFECGECELTSCEEDLECDPQSGRCYEPPTACTAEDPDCPDGSLCNTFDGRCEPIGIACDYATRTVSCDLGIMRCTAARDGQVGTCEETCFGVGSCPGSRSQCVAYHGVIGSFCDSPDTGGAHTCGRLMPLASAIGRPCTTDGDPRDPTVCTSAAADYCLEGIDDNAGGFCTIECDSDEACGAGNQCVAFDAGSFCVPAACDCLLGPDLADGELDLVADAAALAGTTRCGVSFTLTDHRALVTVQDRDDTWRIDTVNPLRGDPLLATTALDDELGGLVVDVAAERGTSAVLGFALTAWGEPIDPADPVVPDDVSPLVEVITAYQAQAGGLPPEPDEVTEIEALPDDVEIAVAALLESMSRDYRDANWQVDAFFGLEQTAHHLFMAGDEGPEGIVFDEAFDTRFFDGVARGRAASAAANLAVAMDAFPDSFESDLTDVSFSYELQGGWLHIGGTGDDVWTAADGPIVLLVELGGDDTYDVPVGASIPFDLPIAAAIDMGGADTYGYVEVADPEDGGRLPSDGAGRAEAVRGGDGPVTLSDVGRQGSGLGGVGMLYDLGAGRDSYTTLRLGQGFGYFGIGVLYDEEGDADLQAEAWSQGSGLMGLGLLILGDGGADVTGVHAVQGFGGPGGIGMLVGGAGDDVYTADPGDTGALYRNRVGFAPVNFSAAQGAGVGYPGDEAPTGDLPLSGGLGVLLDLGGADTYVAGAGAQGFGHWHGLGVLRDLDGNDTYLGSSLTHGAAFRFGVGSFQDLAGDDEYGDEDAAFDAENAFGYGEDLGVGVFVDASGEDTYVGGMFNFGVGVLNGFGGFFDLDGNDAYASESNDTFGISLLTLVGREPDTNPRRDAPTFGFFVDGGGSDTYDRPDTSSPSIGDGREWTQVPDEEADLPVFGAAVDGNGTTGIELLLEGILAP